MKCLKNLSIFVLLILVGSIQLAPVEDNSKVYDLIKSDKRFEKLSFIKECENENRPVCSALLDIALRFNESNLEFAKNQMRSDGDFCQNQLLKVLPDVPSSKQTVEMLKSLNMEWFKDTLREDEDTCNKECVHIDFDDYSQKVKRVCYFVYDQYKYLSEKSQMSVEKVNNNNSEQVTQQQQKTIATVNDTKATSALVTQKQTINIESEGGGDIVDVVPANAEIKSTAATAPVSVENKNESQPQPEQNSESKPQETADSKPASVVQEVPLVPEKTESSSTVAVTSNKTETTKDDTKSSVDLESELADHRVFDNDGETQQPDKEQDIDVDGGFGDDDDEYQDNVARDNNRVDENQKFPQEQINDIEGPDNESAPHIQSVPFQEDPDSNFFTYLCIIMFLSILLYVLYHNKQKILALLLEGRRGSRRSRERSRGGSKAAYSKLDCNLEEAITSKKSLNSKSMDIIY